MLIVVVTCADMNALSTRNYGLQEHAQQRRM